MMILNRGQFELKMSDVCQTCPKKDLQIQYLAADNFPQYITLVTCANYEICTTLAAHMEDKQ